MANAPKETAKPKVSKLPLPISDSPLVIDLPDGQKIVVGKLTTGSVIEVATWRGVGRPDSRTSRLMLGVGSGNVNEPDDPSSPSTAVAPTPAPKPKGFAGFVAVATDIIKNFDKINWKATFRALLESQKKSRKPKKVKQQAEPVPSESSTPVAEPAITPVATVHPVSEDAEIEEWLNRITEKASKSAAKSTKKATVTKKAAPKSANTRGKKK